MAGAPQISPQMLQMLSAGGQGAPGGATPPNPQAGAPPAAAAIGRMLQGQRMTPQGSGDMEAKILQQCMVNIGKVLQSIMMVKPKAYATLLKGQSSIHSAIQELKNAQDDEQEHAQMTNSIMQLLHSTPGGSTPTGGVPGGAGPQLG